MTRLAPAKAEGGVDQGTRSNGERSVTVQSSIRVTFGAGSHIGKVRQENQDHYAIVRVARTLALIGTNLSAEDLAGDAEDAAYGMVVADGMGSLAGGRTASVLAIQTGMRMLLESPKWVLRIDEQESRELIDRMRAYLHEVDATLFRATESEPLLLGMGTTLTVAYSVGAHAFFVHAGDSRAYLLRDGALTQLTHDHTLAQSLADAGKIAADSVGKHPSRHVLVNYAGGPRRGIEPEVGTLALRNGDRILLCTDGLFGMVPDSEIVALLSRHDEPSVAAQALIDHALLRGGRDNVTVVLAHYEIPDSRIG